MMARPLLFQLPAETAHEISLGLLGMAARVCGRYVSPVTAGPTEVCGVRFPNRVGLAAGMDKNGTALAAWPLLGFGFVEIGTVTARAQPGNPKPRVFRYPEQRALINRLGFNNHGAAAMSRQLDHWRQSGCWPRVPVGINLGKTKTTPLAEAAADYAESFRQLQDYGDYFVVNVSSPNTPGLRDLQAVGHLREILRALARENTQGKPVLVKIAPDLPDADLADLVAAGEEAGAVGWIATNTTLNHASIAGSPDEQGGLSGAPLRARATEVVEMMCKIARGPVIGVGGVEDAESAREKIRAGAKLVQIYTGLVYAGPGLPRSLAAAIG